MTPEELARELAAWVQERADLFMQENPSEDDEVNPPDTGVLTGFTIECSWVGSDGERWMTTHWMPEMANWDRAGLLNMALRFLGG